ncbi:hypothetical protein [Onishia taeanensis]
MNTHLTRCLNARCFRIPEHLVFSVQRGQTLLLSTDGYWQEYLEASTPQLSLRNDASFHTLTVGPGTLAHIDQASDTDNLGEFSLA